MYVASFSVIQKERHYATVDVRFGVKATKEVAFQFMVNNLLNKEYSNRPMAVAAPRTFVLKMDVTF